MLPKSRRSLWVVEVGDKKFFRCHVCNDIHLGVAGPESCPTCGAKNAYVEIEVLEAKFVMGL